MRIFAVICLGLRYAFFVLLNGSKGLRTMNIRNKLKMETVAHWQLLAKNVV